MTNQILTEVSERYSLPFDTGWDEEKQNMFIRYTNYPQITWTPDVRANTGTDYALVVVADTVHVPVLVIAGAHMWGTQGAAKALTSRAWSSQVHKRFRNSKNFAFVLEISVDDNMVEVSKMLTAVDLGARR